MMIIFLVINVINICANKISEQVFQLYPTEGEFFQNYLSDFNINEQLSCKMYPKVPNVQVINQCEEILRTKGDQFKSISSNTTHFCALSNKNEVVMYEWKNSSIQQVGESAEINPSFYCFNINLSPDFSILVDCYYNKEFFLIQLIDGQSIVSYSIQSSIPTSTKIQSILNGTNGFIVYAQYFEKYSILSLFSSQFFNLSSLINQFVDFDITITISPNIYAITSSEIFQLSISLDFQFYYKYNFSQDSQDSKESMGNFKSINVYYDLSTYSQCDQIELWYINLFDSVSNFKIAKLLGCDSQIIKVSDSCPFKSCQFIQNILQNSQFIIYQSINERCIQSKQDANKFHFQQIDQSNSLLYFNDDTVKMEIFLDLNYNRVNISNQDTQLQFYLKVQIQIKIQEMPLLFEQKYFPQYFDSQNRLWYKINRLQKIYNQIKINQFFQNNVFFFLSQSFDQNRTLNISALTVMSYNSIKVLKIVVYKISVPSIQINLTKSTTSENVYNFTVMCINYDSTYTVSVINIYFQILTKQDTNIYVCINYYFFSIMSTNGFKNYQFSNEASGKLKFYGYSGQLLNYTLTKNETYCNVTQVTFYNAGKINQIYQFEQVLSINYPIEDERQYLIGYINQSLDILSCNYNYNNQYYEFTLLNSINTTINASSLQVANSIYPNMIIIGLNANDSIYLFQYQNDSNSIISYSNCTFKQKFSDFVITYNSIIILIQQKQEIKIMTFNFTNTFTLNQQSIDKLFNNIQFNPIQIIVNTQLLSSFLYINNINEVIIISIDQNSFPIPISLIRVNFTIKQINLVSQQLILSYLCEQNICFQVLSVQNLPMYYYVKNLQSVNFDNKIIIQSDNLFFYVAFRNKTVYVYNPQLPYHMSLYYKLELTSPFQCVQSSQLTKGIFYEKSIIISNNNLYFLFVEQGFNLTYQFTNQIFNNSISYPQLIYNYTLTSQQNDTAFYNQFIKLSQGKSIKYSKLLIKRLLFFKISQYFLITHIYQFIYRIILQFLILKISLIQ